MRYFDDGIEGDLLNNYQHDFISEFIRLGTQCVAGGCGSCSNRMTPALFDGCIEQQQS